MWLRNIFRFNTLAESIYRSQNVPQRIRIFQGISLDKLSITPLTIQNPSFLKEGRAKEILEYVKTNKIGNNIRILHALAHIQYNAFMSYVDTVFRFKGETGQFEGEFTKEMRDIAVEEGSHFNVLSNRLAELGYGYGCMPVIPKLTLAIRDTEDSLIERIGVISLMHEGRGVKAVDKLLSQLIQLQDHTSASIVRIIQNDECRHFEMGWKWFLKVCQLRGLDVADQISIINSKYKCSIVLPKLK